MLWPVYFDLDEMDLHRRQMIFTSHWRYIKSGDESRASVSGGISVFLYQELGEGFLVDVK
jgi:hypothetical protein